MTSKKWIFSTVIGICFTILSIFYVLKVNEIEFAKQEKEFIPIKEVVLVYSNNATQVDSSLRTSEFLASYEEHELTNICYANPTTYDLPEYKPVDAESVEDIPHVKKGKYKGTKSYEYASAITNKGSKAYELKSISETDENGFLRYKERYLVAIGTHFNAPVGTFITITLENGEEIPAVVGDIKADKHTDQNNVYSMTCICATEFIVSESFKTSSGDVSSIFPEWQSKVASITTYEYNCLE